MSDPPESPARAIARRSRILTTPLVLALVGVVVIVAGGIVWAVLGRAPSSVTGQGIVEPRGALVHVEAETLGVVRRVAVRAGDIVPAGAPIVELTRRGSASTVRTPTGGLVVETPVVQGDTVRPGYDVALLTTDPRPVAVRAFIPAGPGKSVKVGMRVLVSPANVPSAQYGSIEGEVTALAPAPASRSRIGLLTRGNETLVDYFLSAGPALEMRVVLQRADTPSGFRWSVGDGPDEAVTAGTLTSVEVITSDRSIADSLTG